MLLLEVKGREKGDGIKFEKEIWFMEVQNGESKVNSDWILTKVYKKKCYHLNHMLSGGFQV